MARSDHLIEKRTLLTRQELRKTKKLVDGLADRIECSVSFSNLVRGLLRLALRTDQKELARLRRPDLKRPANGDKRALEEFEEQIADLLYEALDRSQKKRL